MRRKKYQIEQFEMRRTKFHQSDIFVSNRKGDCYHYEILSNIKGITNLRQLPLYLFLQD